MIKEFNTCDHEGCDQVKQATNHWFTATRDTDYPQLFEITKGIHRNGRHFCGQKHALAAFQQWMDEEAK